MQAPKRNFGSREGRARQGESAQVQTIVRIVRRLGVVLGAALDCSIRELAGHDMIATAEILRDELKPLVDALVHFELQDAEEDRDVP